MRRQNPARLRSKREIKPSVDKSGTRYFVLTNNEGQSFEFTVTELLGRRSRIIRANGQKRTTGTSTVADAMESFGKIYLEKCQEVEELKQEIERLRRFYSE